MRKRLFGILLSLALVLTMMPILGLGRTAYANDSVTYLDADGKQQSITDYTEVDYQKNAWSAGWYVVKGQVTINDNVRIDGDVHLILCDDSRLNVTMGISGNSNDDNISIYAQSTGGSMGELEVNNHSGNAISTHGSVTINGGKVTAAAGKTSEPGDNTSGISAGAVTINGGKVETKSSDGSGHGIKSSGDVTISGGEVKAEGKEGEGIYSKGNVTISGGSVTATGVSIGISADNDVTISGGTVLAKGTSEIASSGISTVYGTVTISGGEVTASGGDRAIKGDVKNAIAGTGWENVDGSGAGTDITVKTDTGRTLEYKKVHFLAVYPLWVGGTQVTGVNASDIPATGGTKNGKASYDAEANTLTLNGYSYSGEGNSVISFIDEYKIISHYAVLYDDAKPLNIVLSGENSLACTGGEDDLYFGIRSKGDLTISGTGSASVNGSATGIIIGSINAPAMLDIAGGSVTVRQAEGNAFEVYGGMRIGEGAGTVIAETTGTYYAGIYVYGGDGLAVKGGSLTAAGGKEGISIRKGPVVIGNNCAVAAEGSAQAITGSVKNAVAGIGWSDKAGTEGKTAIAIKPEGQDLAAYKKVQFPAETEKVTVTFDSAGGSAVAAQTLEKGAKATKPADPTRDGYTFDGWYNGNTAFDFSTAINEDITLTAHWKTSTPESKAKPVAAVKGIAKGKTALKFTWNKVDGAASYEIWMAKCNTAKKKYSVKRVKKLGADKTTYTKKKLKKNTAYRFYVVAKDSSGNVISKSLIGHAYTGNVKGKYTNAKSLKVSQSSFTLSKGDTAKIKATQTKARPGKKLCSHAKKLRYKSNNTSVAKVDSSGKITTAGTGTCKIYVQTVNGIWKTVKVIVN